MMITEEIYKMKSNVRWNVHTVGLLLFSAILGIAFFWTWDRSVQPAKAVPSYPVTSLPTITLAQADETQFLESAIRRYERCDAVNRAQPARCFKPDYLMPMLDALADDNARPLEQKLINPMLKNRVCFVAKQSGYWHLFDNACNVP